MIWIFVAGMLSGMSLLVAAIVLTDPNFLDLLAQKFDPRRSFKTSQPNMGDKKKTAVVGRTI